MALSMEEQRILAEIERHLARAEPGLAARLAAFGHPAQGRGVGYTRLRVLACLLVLIAITVASVVAYTLLPLRAASRGGLGGASPTPGHPGISASQHASPADSSALSAK